MSDLAAVRIHSKTISIFSSRPIISRKRWTDGDWSSVLTRGAPLEEVVEQLGRARSFGGRSAMYRGGVAGKHPRDAEVDQLADAVLDVEPQPAERLHQRLDVEASSGRALQIAEDAGAQRRLHQRAEPRIDVRRARPFGDGGRRCARRALKVRSSIFAVIGLSGWSAGPDRAGRGAAGAW